MDEFHAAQTLIEGLRGVLASPDFRSLIQLQHMVMEKTAKQMTPNEMSAAVCWLEDAMYGKAFIQMHNKEP
jgi:hypothetical protein